MKFAATLHDFSLEIMQRVERFALLDRHLKRKMLAFVNTFPFNKCLFVPFAPSSWGRVLRDASKFS